MQLEQTITNYTEIIERLNKGMKFGLFDKGMKCYFQDGTHVSYQDLWKAVKMMHNIESATNKSLSQLCPDTYVGVHSYKHSKHNWKKSHAA